MTSKLEQYKRNLVVEECVKANVPQTFGLHGGSGSGKSVTAIVLAMGLIGPDKRVGVVDGENRRSGWAADVALDLAMKHYGKQPPIPLRIQLDDCHPLNVAAAIEMLIEKGCDAIVADCMTQAWECYLDLKEEALQRMAGDDWKKRERVAMAAAAQAKPGTHGVMTRIIRGCPVHLVLCFRGKKLVKMGKGQDGRTEVKQDDFSTPIQETGLIFDCLVAGEVVAKDGVGGYCLWKGPGRKTTHPDVIKLLPGEDEQFHFKHAEALAQWCAGKQSANLPLAQAPIADVKTLKKQLWDMTAHIHSGAATPKEQTNALTDWLWNEELMSVSEALSSLPANRLQEIIEAIQQRQQQ